MTTVETSFNRATALLYKVVWMPENWPPERKDFMTSYVVAMSMDEAGARLSSNKFDIKSVVMVSHVIERGTDLSNHKLTALVDDLSESLSRAFSRQDDKLFREYLPGVRAVVGMKLADSWPREPKT